MHICESSPAYMTREGVVRPERMIEVVAPGFDRV
jgi:hypothetical protein